MGGWAYAKLLCPLHGMGRDGGGTCMRCRLGPTNVTMEVVHDPSHDPSRIFRGLWSLVSGLYSARRARPGQPAVRNWPALDK
jgi:hypothetical protein